MTKERLTQRNEFGNAEIIVLSNSMSDLYGTLLTYKERDALTDAFNKLADYEDKEENIEAISTVNMQEVVRCKECSFYEEVDYFPNGRKNVCRLLKRQMYADDFCSYGTKG